MESSSRAGGKVLGPAGAEDAAGRTAAAASAAGKTPRARRKSVGDIPNLAIPQRYTPMDISSIFVSSDKGSAGADTDAKALHVQLRSLPTPARSSRQPSSKPSTARSSMEHTPTAMTNSSARSSNVDADASARLVVSYQTIDGSAASLSAHRKSVPHASCNPTLPLAHRTSLSRASRRSSTADADKVGQVVACQVIGGPSLPAQGTSGPHASCGPPSSSASTTSRARGTSHVWTVRKIRQLFRAWDANGDGVITRDEVRRLMNFVMDGQLQENIIDRLMEAADKDEDGVISAQEFFDWMFDERSGMFSGNLEPSQILSAQSPAIRAALLSWFKLFDVNNSGYLDYKEFERAQLLVKKDANMMWVLEYYQSMDYSGDERISWQEFFDEHCRLLDAIPRPVHEKVALIHARAQKLADAIASKTTGS